MAEEKHAVITHAHGDYQRGDVVTDPLLVEALLRDQPSKAVAITPAKQN